MNAAVGRLFQGVAICTVPVVFVALAWPPGLRLPQLWMALGVGILGNTLQPSYSPFEGQRTQDDHHTGVQIVWSIYVVQAAALVELVIRQPSPHLHLVSWLAFIAMVLGLALRTWAVLTLGRWFTWNVEVQRNQAVVRTGPYRYLRHPSYAGALFTYVGVSLLFNSWVAALLALVVLPLAFLRRIAYEERLLRRLLPDYESYMKTTHALFPSLRPGRD